jgi:bifunctional non-homologous end joining protein LigD
MTPPPDDRLRKYREKRSPDVTPEPFGRGVPEAAEAAPPSAGKAASPGAPRLFVVQMHHARNLHWDLRLEMNGALESWAVPKGPSPDMADKRLAMHVEPHPLEYADFEGVIPEGQYGAGPSICWDRGVWIEIPGEKHGLEHGKLLFELRGYKLRGLWTLVHTPKAGDNHWLLIKERDGFLDDRGTDVYPPDSIFSGLTVDELPDPSVKAKRLVERARKAGAKPGPVVAKELEVMKAVPLDAPVSREGWVFEIKYDGYRLLGDRGEDRGGGGGGSDGVSLWSRAGNDLTATFPEIARAVRGLPFPGTVLDGEVVVHDAEGLPSFSHLQKRGRLQRPADIARAAVALPATYYVFDLLAFGGLDLRPLPLLERKALLRELLPSVGPLRYSDHIPTVGEAMYRQAEALGLEGVVGKKADGPYRSGRSEEWIKVRTIRTDDFVVVGWTEPKGTRGGFGALHLGRYMDGKLTYSGSVGTGFSESLLAEMSQALAAAEVPAPPVEPSTPSTPLPKGKAHHWVRPERVVEVRYKEVTPDGMLRHPAFVRTRDDKPPEECQGPPAPPPAENGDGDHLPEPLPVLEEPDERKVAYTNLEKVLWPQPKLTKGHLIGYGEAIAPWILPYLRDRCLVLTRYPDGIDGNSFYQKNAPDWAPDWIRTETVYSDGSERDLDYFVVDDEAGLLYVLNSAALLLHVWSSRVTALERPDWCILDLDPKEAPFLHVVRVARRIREICQAIGLPSFIKTSGSSGLHVLLPLGGMLDYEQSKILGQLLATVVVKELPEIATITRQVRSREGKVYVDFLQNGWGKLLVAPFSPRPVTEAAVSMPLHWDEVTDDLDIRTFTIVNAPGRMEALGADPLLPVMTARPELGSVLERLGEWVGGGGPEKGAERGG